MVTTQTTALIGAEALQHEMRADGRYGTITGRTQSEHYEPAFTVMWPTGGAAPELLHKIPDTHRCSGPDLLFLRQGSLLMRLPASRGSDCQKTIAITPLNVWLSRRPRRMPMPALIFCKWRNAGA
jgi:hypothetical protein